MKKLLLSAIFTLFIGSASAQLVNTGSDTNYVNGPASEFELVAKANVRNTGTSSATFRWVRITNSLTANWKSAVCDVITCYSDLADSSDFTLNANEIGNIDVHFYPFNTAGTGLTRVRVFEVGNPSNSVTITFMGSTGASIADVKKPEFKLFPIPATDVLYLKSVKNLGNGHLEIYNVIGKKVLEMNFSSANQNIEIPVATLPKGNYIIRVSNGKQVVSKSFIKN